MKSLLIIVAFWLACIWLGAFFGEEGIGYGWIFALLCLACGIPAKPKGSFKRGIPRGD